MSQLRRKGAMIGAYEQAGGASPDLALMRAALAATMGRAWPADVVQQAMVLCCERKHETPLAGTRKHDRHFIEWDQYISVFVLNVGLQL